MYQSDRDSARVMLSRVELEKTRDDEGLQRATVKGLAGEVIKEAHRLQMYGLTSHAPAGGHGFLLSAGGRRDQAVLLGLEHQDHRPRDLPEGATRLYDTADGYVYLDADGNLFANVQKGASIKAGERIVLEAPEIILRAGAIKMEKV